MLHHFQLPEILEVPQSFRDGHYSLGDVLRLLQLDGKETGEWEFWRAYKAGRIPPGVWLPAEQPAVCWARDVIDDWIDAGMPAMAGVEDHERRVYAALLDGIEQDLPAVPVNQVEVN